MTLEWSKHDDRGLARYVNRAVTRMVALDVNRLDLLQQPDGRRRLVQMIYERLLQERVRYASELHQPDRVEQTIRTPQEVLTSPREGTSLDLALVFAGLAMGNGLLPVVVVTQRHAVCLVSLTHGIEEFDALSRREHGLFAERPVTDGAPLIELVDRGDYLAVDCSGFAESHAALEATAPEGRGRIGGFLPFDRAVAAGREQLSRPDSPVSFALDIGIAQLGWQIKPFDIAAARHHVIESFTVDLGEREGTRLDAADTLPKVTRRRRPVTPQLGAPVRFVDRDAALGQATSGLFTGHVVAISGGPGSGRTALLRRLYHSGVLAVPVDGATYIPAARMGLRDIMQAIWSSFHLSDVPFDRNIVELGEAMRDVNALIMVDDAPLSASERVTLRDLLPECTVIITGPPGSEAGAAGVELAGLAVADAVALLQTFAGRELTEDERGHAAEVARALEGHPAALVEAGHRLASGVGLTSILADAAPATASAGVERDIVTLLTAAGAPLHRRTIDAVIGHPLVSQALASLVARERVQTASPLYTISDAAAADRRAGRDGLGRPVADAPAEARRLDGARAALAEHFASHLAGWGVAERAEELDAAAEAMTWAVDQRRFDVATSIGTVLLPAAIAASRLDSWREIAVKLRAVATATGNQELEGRALHELGARALVLGDGDLARRFLDDALAIRQQLGHRNAMGVTEHNLGLLPPEAPPVGPADQTMVMPEQTPPPAVAPPPPAPPPPPPTEPEPIESGSRWTRVLVWLVAVMALAAGVLWWLNREPPPEEAGPAVITAPDTIDFGAVAVGVTASMSLEVANEGGEPATVQASLEPADGPFAIVADTCADGVAADSTCAIDLEFLPPAEGEFTAELTVDSGLGTVLPVQLLGTGRGDSNLRADPAELDFGPAEFNSEDFLEEFIIINNGGDGSIEIDGVEVQGDGFTLVNEDCQTTLQPDDACRALVRFQPVREDLGDPPDVEPARLTGSLQLFSEGAVVLDVPLTGAGEFVLPDLAVSVEPLMVSDGSLEDLNLGRFGEPVIRVTIDNLGDVAASGVTVDIQLSQRGGDPAIMTEAIAEDIPPGGTVDLELAVPVPARLDQSYVVEAFVDRCTDGPSFCAILETDEGNNLTEPVELNRVVARSEVRLDTNEQRTQSGETNFGDLIADAILSAAQSAATRTGTGVPTFGLAAAATINTAEEGIARGELRLLRLWQSVAPEEVVVVQVPDGDLVPILDAGVNGGRGSFPQVAGMSFLICDVGGSVGQVTDPEGNPIPAGQYGLATARSLAEGQFGYPLDGRSMSGTGILMAQALVDYLDGRGGEIRADEYPEGGAGRIEEGPCPE